MRWLQASSLAMLFFVTSCSSNNGASAPGGSPLPPANSSPAVPASVLAAPNYHVSVFATIPTSSAKPDSLVQIGSDVYVGVGDDVGPDGSPGPSGKTNVEILDYSLSGTLKKTYSVPGHNDGLMAYDSNTLWAMSNEDCNPRLVVINLSSGTQRTYAPQPSLVTAGCLSATNGGIDDMQLMGGTVYVSASNPNPTPPGPCAANSSTPGCPNGVSTVPAVFALTLNSDGATFDLTPILTSGATVANALTGAPTALNMTDPDSEAVSLDGSTIVVDSQQDSELALIRNPGANQAVSVLPLTLGGALTAVDDSRYAPTARSFMLVADTPNNTIFRVDASFVPGEVYSAAPTQVAHLNLATGVLSPVVTGMGAPHGLIFVTAP